ncbi:efflux RND transporter periplasmic adaptor subunit [Bacillus aquiflavi]|nr:efflux RND transporter periplasmic adaptor subunit [Bacillus aquiflavi]
MKKVLIWILVGAIILAGIWFFLLRNKGVNKTMGDETPENTVAVQKAKEEELSETILVTGEIVPESEQKVYLSPEKGEIIEFKVEENQAVKAGDPLVIYDTSKQQAELNKVVRERDLVQKRIKAEENQIKEKNQEMAQAKKNGDPKEVIDQLVKEKSELDIQYETTKAEIQGFQEQINEIENQKKEMVEKSKMDGIVVKVNKNVAKTESGSTEPVVHIISNEPYKVVGTMSEFDAVKIKPEQHVIIRPKVYKDREWKGVVESVSQFPKDEGAESGVPGEGGNVTMYPFKVVITDDTSELRQGFHVSLEIRLDEGGKTLAVPRSAVADEDGTNIVYVLKDKKLQRREVETGSESDEFVQIKSGVEKGELIVLMAEGMYDGMEVSSFDEIK